jgi:tRNA pseudouridine38-40 synthase
LRVAYDGTDFHGWARQPSGADGREVRTVQGELERALATLHKQPVSVRGASRTDAGVHALGQLAAFEPPLHIPMAGLVRGLDAVLPPDARVLAAWEQPGEIDVRRGNLGKQYRYRLRCSEVADPLHRRHAWHVARGLDLAAMRDAATRLVGTHDFGSFRSSACQAATTTRTIVAIELEGRADPVGPSGDPGRLDVAGPADVVDVHVRGTAFLHNMVRILAGTLVDVGLGKRSPDEMNALLAHPDRRRAGPTAPAHGLVLMEVLWPQTFARA